MPPGDETRWWWEEKKPGGDLDLSWANLLAHWRWIESDFHHFYGVDFEDGVLSDRTWRWFTLRLFRLLGEDSGLARALGITGRTSRGA